MTQLLGSALGLYGATQGAPATNVNLPDPSAYMLPFGGATSPVASNLVTGIGNIPTTDYGTTGAGANLINAFLGGPLAGAPSDIVTSLIGSPNIGRAFGGADEAAGLGRGAAQTQYNAGMGAATNLPIWMQNLSNQVQGLGTTLGGAGASLIPYASTIMNLGLDPQNELYQRTLHNVTEQTRAGLEARGIDMTPYGAGLENKAISDFNIDWRQQRLADALAGAGGASGLINTAGGALTGAGNLFGEGGNLLTRGYEGAIGGAKAAGDAASALGQFSGLPFSTQSGISQQLLEALSGARGATGANLGLLKDVQGLAGGAQGLQQNPLQLYLQYLQTVNQSGGVANQAGYNRLQQANLGFNQQQRNYAQAGNALGGIGGFLPWGGATGWGGFQGSPFSGGGGGGGGGGFSGMTNAQIFPGAGSAPTASGWYY